MTREKSLSVSLHRSSSHYTPSPTKRNSLEVDEQTLERLSSEDSNSNFSRPEANNQASQKGSNDENVKKVTDKNTDPSSDNNQKAEPNLIDSDLNRSHQVAAEESQNPADISADVLILLGYDLTKESPTLPKISEELAKR